jgi:hypothetical protein
LCHRDTEPSTAEVGLCEIKLKRFAHLWWEKAQGQEKDSGFVDLGEPYLKEGSAGKRKVSVRPVAVCSAPLMSNLVSTSRSRPVRRAKLVSVTGS